MNLAQFDEVSKNYVDVQENACVVLEQIEPETRFSRDKWNKEIGYGITRVLENGKFLEKAAVNFSNVSGKYTQQMAETAGQHGKYFNATGVSSIIHPVHPHAPIIHMNIRYFELDNGKKWFGGGIDLTPHYIDKQEAKYFHHQLKSLCDAFGDNFYSAFKEWADQYFYIPHRDETRGIGGIFFDQLEPDKNINFENLLEFTVRLGRLYPSLYTSIIKQKHNHDYTAKEKEWQLIRRSRYAEFNLVYDRGTRFGLESGGNAESILISLPPEVRWKYHVAPEKNSEEQKTLTLLKKGIDWINIEL